MSLMENPHLPPPGGDPNQAEKYISQLIHLIEKDKLTVTHTDLSKFNPGIMQDHYRLELREYQVEVSHNKHPNSGKDSHIILFTNIRNQPQTGEKIILAYMHLEESQFMKFTKASIEQEVRRKRAEEEKRLKSALEPVDQILEQLSHQEALRNGIVSN